MIIAFEENGISKEREATAEEIAYIADAQAEAQAAKAEEQSILSQRALDKAALLERLGITDEEAKLLLS
jgi:hypothetical protein